MSKNRVGGTIALKVNGETLYAKGNFAYNLGRPRKEGVVGSDRVHGYKEMPQIPYIEGEITDRGDLDMEAVRDTVDATVTIELANGKVIAVFQAWEASEGTGNTEEGNQTIRFEGIRAEEIR